MVTAVLTVLVATLLETVPLVVFFLSVRRFVLSSLVGGQNRGLYLCIALSAATAAALGRLDGFGFGYAGSAAGICGIVWLVVRHKTRRTPTGYHLHPIEVEFRTTRLS